MYKSVENGLFNVLYSFLMQSDETFRNASQNQPLSRVLRLLKISDEVRWKINFSNSPVEIDCNFWLAACLRRSEFFKILRYNDFVKIEANF